MIFNNNYSKVNPGKMLWSINAGILLLQPHGKGSSRSLFSSLPKEVPPSGMLHQHSLLLFLLNSHLADCRQHSAA